MRDQDEAFAEANIGIAAIGTGDLAYAQEFKSQREISFPLLVDEARTSYRIVGTRRAGLSDAVRPGILAAGAKAATRGVMQGRTGKDPLRLGASHLVMPDGAIPFAWVNADYADNAPIEAVIEAARG